MSDRIRLAPAPLLVAVLGLVADLLRASAGYARVLLSDIVGSALGACGTPIDKKLSMSRRCDTLAGDSLRSRGNSRSTGTT